MLLLNGKKKINWIANPEVFDGLRNGRSRRTDAVLQGHYFAVLRIYNRQGAKFGGHPRSTVVAGLLGSVKAHYDCHQVFRKPNDGELKRRSPSRCW